ncbi:MAG: hypothetical protein L6W00_21465 [Lentisphaeria bacterium]|nr:MAG: hypothetical protein L6W00_21465 [Lentisphaeria bacterium]
MAESLLAVGGGNPLPVAELACAAMDSGRIDTGIPLFGFELLVLPGLRRWDYRWKKSFLLPGVARSGDRLFDWFEAAELPTDARNLLLLNRMSFEMATLRYDRALATRKRIPLDDAKLASLVEFPRWELPAPGWLPGFAEFQDPVPLLKLFTGKSGPALQALEREFLRGKRDVPEKLPPWSVPGSGRLRSAMCWSISAAAGHCRAACGPISADTVTGIRFAWRSPAAVST